MLENRRASHAILMHRRGFSTFCRGCVASQRVAGPIGSMLYVLSKEMAMSPYLRGTTEGLLIYC